MKELGAEVAEGLDDGAVVVGVLRGCLPFLADLVRAVDRRLEIDFLSLSAFAPDSGRVRLTRDVGLDVSGRQVLLVEDMVDTGLRLDFLLRHLRNHEASEVRVCTLFDRVDRRVLPVPVDYVGFVLEEPFVVGYGLDHRGLFRNLPGIVTLDQAQLEADLDSCSEPGGDAMVDDIRTLARAGSGDESRVPA
ncbi:MAG: hypoxanthine phosphoribosyltransferase [Actinobacteria bacterium]|nr:hypoxanthine phosphoribosyltransferase [Actinomycetota bacterium]